MTCSALANQLSNSAQKMPLFCERVHGCRWTAALVRKFRDGLCGNDTRGKVVVWVVQSARAVRERKMVCMRFKCVTVWTLFKILLPELPWMRTVYRWMFFVSPVG